jgi:hypothetical protein
LALLFFAAGVNAAERVWTGGGPVVVTNQCRLAICCPTALGSAAAGTTVCGPNETRLEIYGGLTLDEPLTFLGTDGAPNYYPCLRSYNAPT